MNVEDIRRIAIVGAGLLGHGIAQEFSLSGYDVSLHDLTDEQLQTAKANMKRNLDMLVEAGIAGGEQAASVPDRIRASTELAEVVAGADVVIEAITEDLPLKQRIFRELDGLCPERTIIASNSSSFMPSLMASATQRPDKVLVTHYFNPPYLVPLVEVVRHAGTSDETFETIFSLLEKIGKRPVGIQKELPGFIANRIQFALLRECVSLVESGAASPQDVDTVVRYGFGRRLAAAGPFEISDIAGLDTLSAIIAQLFPEIDARRDESPLVREKVERGELGVKTGKGFYEWTPESGEALRRRIATALLEIEKWSKTD